MEEKEVRRSRGWAVGASGSGYWKVGVGERIKLRSGRGVVGWGAGSKFNAILMHTFERLVSVLERV
jgi:hypothetical protein